MHLGPPFHEKPFYRLKQCFASVFLTQIYPLSKNKLYYLFKLIFHKYTHPNETHILKYVNLENYTLSITLDICKKYPY
jgi:hypothetical protein